MAYTAKVKKVEKVRHQSSNSNFLDVAFEILDEEGDVVAERWLGMDPGMSAEDVRAEVEKYVATFTLEKEQAVRQRELDKEDANVTEVKAALEGVEISPVRE